MSPGISVEASIASRARIRLRLPRTVLISPLCAMYRNGCASGHAGNVLVENRECTMATALLGPLVGDVGVERRQLLGGQHALVDDGAAGQRREVDTAARSPTLGGCRRARSACGPGRPSGPARCRTAACRRRRRGRPGTAARSRASRPAPSPDAGADRVRRHGPPAEQRRGSPRRRSLATISFARARRAGSGGQERQPDRVGLAVPRVGPTGQREVRPRRAAVRPAPGSGCRRRLRPRGRRRPRRGGPG